MSICADRIAENMDIFDFELTEVEMTRIAAMDTGASRSSTTATLLCRPAGQLPPRLTGIGRGDAFTVSSWTVAPTRGLTRMRSEREPAEQVTPTACS
jgi:hypothetical protein